MRRSWVFLVLMLSGCAGYVSTREDQVRSLMKFDTGGINAVVPFPELGDRTKAGMDARQYLTLHSMITLSADHFEDVEYEAVVGLLNEGNFARSAELNETLHERWNLVGGMSFPITDDGYLLTAAHLLENEETRVMFLGVDASSRVRTEFYPCRIVFRNDESDFAILKADVETPRYLRYRTEPLTPGEVVFAGGWWNESGGGVFRGLDQRLARGPDRTFEYEVLTTSVPLREKDSGSPLIDREGRFCGVVVQVVVGRFWKMAPKSRATMIDPRLVDEIIRKDRARYAAP